MPPYERFTAWHHSHQLVLNVYRVTAGFPSSERFGLVSQARRAAVSVAANLAEGSAKRGSPEFRRYLDISIGSLAELSYMLRVAKDLGIMTQSQWDALDTERETVSKLLWGLYKTLARRVGAKAPQ